MIEDTFAIDIITEHHLGIEVNRRTPHITCFGAYFLNPRTHLVDTILSKTTLIATGGGRTGLQYYHDSPYIDRRRDCHGIPGQKDIENMEFMQFHPTALYNPEEKPSFLYQKL